MELAAVAERFENFATVEADHSSPLYAALARRILGDPELLALADRARINQPRPHLFLAAVQYLLRQESGPFDPEHGVDESYRRLVRVATERRDELEEILARRIVQTNEVRRSIYLFSSFGYLSRLFPDREFALIEIGASAGFNLLFDKYGYRYDHGPAFGALDSSVQTSSTLRGEGRPPTGFPRARIVSRTGIDLNPLDANCEEDASWLRALLWPEHRERREFLEAALAVRRREQVRMVEGDGAVLLASLVGEIPGDVVPFVFHTHVAYQMPNERKRELLDEIDRQGAERDVVHLHNNIEDHLHATFYRGGERFDIPMADADAHARWVEWFAPATPPMRTDRT